MPSNCQHEEIKLYKNEDGTIQCLECNQIVSILNTLQPLVKKHYQKWIGINQYVMPNLTDALDFMATEVAEAIEKRLRRTSYIRNNPEDYPDNRAIAIEIFDAIMMGCIALDILGEDLMNVAQEKLKRMDDKRK